jgi:hypothetical protein
MIKDPEFYRAEAERARRSADRARTFELRQQWRALAGAYERLADAAEDLARGDAVIPISRRMRIGTVDALRRLIGEVHLAGFNEDQIATLIHEARIALGEAGGDLARVVETVRRLAASMRGG